MFYPNEHRTHFSNAVNFGTGRKDYGNFINEDKFMKSRKSLVGKINALNEDRYRTPLTKIYQPQ
jgi:hypothetical protein